MYSARKKLELTPLPVRVSVPLSNRQEIHFLFSMEDSRDAFNIPHDLRIYKEVFTCERATRENEFWKAYDLPKVDPGNHPARGSLASSTFTTPGRGRSTM